MTTKCFTNRHSSHSLEVSQSISTNAFFDFLFTICQNVHVLVREAEGFLLGSYTTFIRCLNAVSKIKLGRRVRFLIDHVPYFE